MEVILLEKIKNLGDVGNKVSVKPGYGRNFLIPRKKAVSATAGNIVKFEKMRGELEKKASEILAKAKARAEKLAQLVLLTITAQASDEGKLFGSVGTKEIVAAITAAGGEIDRKEINLPEGPIRQVGEHTINLQLHSDVTVPLKINVVAE
jgi:large subunit ribosomal protein L9